MEHDRSCVFLSILHGFQEQLRKAISQSRPLLVVPHQHPHTKMKQIYQLPCIRSSRNVQPEIDKLCSGCLNEICLQCRACIGFLGPPKDRRNMRWSANSRGLRVGT